MLLLNKKTQISKTPRRKRKSFTKPKNARSGEKCHAFGYEFDSKAERNWYMILRSDKDIKEVEVQPGPFELIPSFFVTCHKCNGTKKEESTKRPGNMINCKRCRGAGELKRHDMSYTPDFKVVYKNGIEEYQDVKGYTNQVFPYYKKLFEKLIGKELVIIQMDDRGGFKRK